MRFPLAALMIGVAGCLASGIGCVSAELRSMRAAEEAYEACTLEKSASHGDCIELRESRLEEQRRYEENSRRAWSCDPSVQSCPTPR